MFAMATSFPTVPTQNSQSGQALRVVVADNDPDALELVCTDLAYEGQNIVGAVLSGDEALALVRSTSPDVVVLDYRMPPGPTGLEVLRALRAEELDVYVIVYSNYRDPRMVQEVRALGATFLDKGRIRDLRKAVAAARQ